MTTKLERRQQLEDLRAEANAPLTQAERAYLWPESGYGGDGPWNDYGGDGPSVYLPAPTEPFIGPEYCF